MKDLHSHILYGIDDGCRSIDSSMEVLRSAYEAGVTDIIFTPHFIENSKYSVNNREKLKLFDTLKDKLKEEDIPINLYLGNEIYINENILNLIKSGDIYPLNNSRYLLIEFPMAQMYRNTKNIIFDLIRAGYRVVLAHPERYRYLQNDMEEVDELLEMGVLLQGNYRSLFGYYGSDAKKCLKKLIKTHRVTFLGSDIHTDDGYYTKKLHKKLKKLTKDDLEVENLLGGNFDFVIANKDIVK